MTTEPYARIAVLVTATLSIAGLFVGFFGEDLNLMSESTALITTYSLFSAAAASVVSIWLLEAQRLSHSLKVGDKFRVLACYEDTDNPKTIIKVDAMNERGQAYTFSLLRSSLDEFVLGDTVTLVARETIRKT